MRNEAPRVNAASQAPDKVTTFLKRPILGAFCSCGGRSPGTRPKHVACYGTKLLDRLKSVSYILVSTLRTVSGIDIEAPMSSMTRS